MARAGVAIAAVASLGLGGGLAAVGSAPAGAATESTGITNPLGPGGLDPVVSLLDQVVVDVQIAVCEVVGIALSGGNPGPGFCTPR
jgi:hypothetical protein